MDFPKVEEVRRRALQEYPTVWTLDLGGGYVCRRQYDSLVFSSKPLNQQVSYTYPLSLAHPRMNLAEIGKVMEMRVLEREGFTVQEEGPGKRSAWFDGGELVLPLTIRSRLPGDTIRVMGLNGSKKVKDIYIDDKIPSSERSAIPLVCDGLGNIIWIPGVRRSNHALVKRHTDTVLLLTLEDMEQGEQT